MTTTQAQNQTTGQKWLGRDPAVLTAQVVGIILAALVLLPMPDVVRAVIGGAVTAGSGFLIAAAVKRDGQLAAFMGFARAIVALMVVLGVNWDPIYQAGVLFLVEQVAAVLTRDRVQAPVPATTTGPQAVH